MPERAARAGSWAPFAWLVVAAAALLFAALSLWDQQAERGTMEAEYSTYRADTKGARALYLTLEGLGLRVERWERDFARLPSPGMLLVLDPPASRKRVLEGGGDILPDEIAALDDWVKRGNTAVVMSDRPNSIYEALAVFPSVPGKPPVAAPAQPGPMAAGVKEIALQSGRVLRYGHEAGDMWHPKTAPDPSLASLAIDPQEWQPLFGTSADPVVVTSARGAGAYVLVADPSPAGNLGLAKPGNLRFMTNLAAQAPGGLILFDEAHHRELSRGFMAYARARMLMPFIVCLLAVTGLVIWRSGVRFGLPVPLVADPRRDSSEYVQAVAALYQNAGMARDALAAIYDHFRRRCAAWLNLGNRWRADVVAQRLAQRVKRPAAEIFQTLTEIEAALARGNLTEEQAFTLTMRLAALESEFPSRGAS